MNVTQKDLAGVFILVIFAGGLSFLYNHLSPNGIAMVGQWDAAEGELTARSRQISADTSSEITDPAAVKAISESHSRIIVDVRPAGTYDLGHIPGALSFPLEEIDEQFTRLLHRIDRKSPVLIYCSSAACTDSDTFADRLRKLKYADVKVFPGGFRQWQEMGYAIEVTE